MTTLDAETRHDLARLRGLHDRTVNRMYRHKTTETRQLAEDPEMTYQLDALDAIIEITRPEDAA
jgi:hypothetical protein